VSTGWQWSVDCTKQERDSYIQKDNQYTKEFKNTEYTKWETKIQQKTNMEGILNNISPMIRK